MVSDVNSVMICGIENHVCVQNTVLDLLEDNFDVHLIADACSSRSMTDRFTSLAFHLHLILFVFQFKTTWNWFFFENLVEV